jgi:DNA-binding XRE family transcriptional regulator
MMALDHQQDAMATRVGVILHQRLRIRSTMRQNEIADTI